MWTWMRLRISDTKENDGAVGTHWQVGDGRASDHQEATHNLWQLHQNNTNDLPTWVLVLNESEQVIERM